MINRRNNPVSTNQNFARWRAVQNQQHPGRLLKKRRNIYCRCAFFSSFALLLFVFTWLLSSLSNSTATTKLRQRHDHVHLNFEANDGNAPKPEADDIHNSGLWFGVHQSVDFETSVSNVLMCNGKLFYFSRKDSEPKGITAVVEASEMIGTVQLDTTQVDQNPLVDNIMELCCHRCSDTPHCSGFSMEDRSCVFHAVASAAPLDDDANPADTQQGDNSVDDNGSEGGMQLSDSNDLDGGDGDELVINEQDGGDGDELVINEQDDDSYNGDDLALSDDDNPAGNTGSEEIDVGLGAATKDDDMDDFSLNTEHDDYGDTMNTGKDSSDKMEQDDFAVAPPDESESSPHENDDSTADDFLMMSSSSEKGGGGGDDLLSVGSISNVQNNDPLRSMFNMEALKSAQNFLDEHSPQIAESDGDGSEHLDISLGDGDDEADTADDNTDAESLARQPTLDALSDTPVADLLPMGNYQRQLGAFYNTQTKYFSRFRSLQSMYSMIAETVGYYKNSPLSDKWSVDSVTIGKSSEGKPLKSLEIGNPKRGRHVIVVGALRGCDWTGPLSILHTAVALLGRKSTISKLLDNLRFHFVPLLNPDGYAFSRRKSPSSARNFCKNRRVVMNSHGVMLENNWGVDNSTWGFGKTGKEGARKDDYQGPNPFSEPETRALRSMVNNYSSGSGRVAVVQVRCCSGTVTPPQIYKQASTVINPAVVANKLLKILKMPEHSDYTLKPRTDPFSASNTGQMIDWLYGEANVHHAYAVEIKAAGLTTHKDKYQINLEALVKVSKELEYAVVWLAQQLLKIPVEGEPTPTSFGVSVNPAAQTATSGSGKRKPKH